ncbi:hypothetical protein JCM9492_05190 [Aquifex pyrophilus]
MERLRYNLKFITEGFLVGADKSIAELRALSLVGVLRWWFRSLLYPHVINSSKELYKYESELFGNTEKASPVRVRFKERNFKQKSETIDKEIKDLDSSISYLGFGNFMGKRQKKAHLQTGDYKLEFILTNGNLKEKLEPLLYIFSQLGSIGSRNRRGFGSLVLIPQGESVYKDWGRFHKGELLKAYRDFLEQFEKENSHDFPFEIYEFRRFNEPLEALKTIGECYRQFRRKLDKLSKNNLRNYLREYGLKKPYFGLPIMYKRGKIKANLKIEENKTRFPSPVRFKVMPSIQGYTVLIIHQKYLFEPSENWEIIVEGYGKQIYTFKSFNRRVFYDFIKSIGAREVIK